MKYLRSVRKMFSLGMQNGCEMPVMFEQGDAFVRDPIHYRLGTESSFANAQEPRLHQSSDAPAEAIAGTLVAAKCHQLEQLLMAGKLRVADLPQQRYIAVGLDNDAVLDVSHKRDFKRNKLTDHCRT